MIEITDLPTINVTLNSLSAGDTEVRSGSPRLRGRTPMKPQSRSAGHW